jgi:hypothetical protein
MNNILIDMVTGTVLNYDTQVVVVDTESLNETEQALLDEWYECGNDSTIISLGALKGTSIVDYKVRKRWWKKS